jgi:alkylation response protein AidB-like acyl-CoA dehydrogenase
VAPLWSVSDERFNEVTLTGPVMGPDDVLGAVDEGWHVIGQVLALERTGIELEAKSRRLVQNYLDLLGTDGGTVNPVLAETLVRLDAEATAGQLLSWRAIRALLAGESIDVPTAMAKWHTSEVVRTLAALGPDVCGVTAGLAAGDPDAAEGWRIESAYRDAPGFTLASGTSEMMLSIVAAAGLRLGG